MPDAPMPPGRHGAGDPEKKKKARKKKEAQLVIRLEKETRDRFVDACQDLDTSASREIRKFMKQFLRRFDRGELEEQD